MKLKSFLLVLFVILTALQVCAQSVDSFGKLQPAITTVVQTKLYLKADLASPVFTGIPVVLTATAGHNSTQIVTTAFVKSTIVGSVVDLTTN
jgi:hypothetical protein